MLKVLTFIFGVLLLCQSFCVLASVLEEIAKPKRNKK